MKVDPRTLDMGDEFQAVDGDRTGPVYVRMDPKRDPPGMISMIPKHGDSSTLFLPVSTVAKHTWQRPQS